MTPTPIFGACALAHGGEPHTFRDLLTTWDIEPLVVICLVLSAWMYIRGLGRIWRSAGVGHGVREWESWCYAGGWFALFIALVSPLHPWGSVLFSAHMTQHEILMLVAAPLLVLGRPLVVFLHALPARWSRWLGAVSNRPAWARTWAVVSGTFTAWLIHAAILWAWLMPLPLRRRRWTIRRRAPGGRNRRRRSSRTAARCEKRTPLSSNRTAL